MTFLPFKVTGTAIRTNSVIALGKADSRSAFIRPRLNWGTDNRRRIRCIQPKSQPVQASRRPAGSGANPAEVVVPLPSSIFHHATKSRVLGPLVKSSCLLFAIVGRPLDAFAAPVATEMMTVEGTACGVTVKVYWLAETAVKADTDRRARKCRKRKNRSRSPRNYPI